MEDEIKSSAFVLMVCTPTYLKRYDGEEELGKGLGAIWESIINRQEFYSKQGKHLSHWTLYQRDQSDTISNQEFKTGRPFDGTVRSGDLILGAKPLEEVARHKASLRQKAQRQMGSSKKAALELKRAARNHGLKTVIVEGDDDN